MLTHDHVTDWADAYRSAWENADAAAASDLFSKTSSYRSNIYEEPYLGRAGVQEYWSGVTAAQTDVRVRMGEPVVLGQKSIVEFWTTMSVDGQPVTLAGCLMLNFEDSGLCSALREYWNFESGTHHPPAGWGV